MSIHYKPFIAAAALLCVQGFAASSASAITVDFQMKSVGVSTYTTDVYIKNDTTAAISGWAVTFKLGNTIKSSYSVGAITGTDPYTATNTTSNGAIAIGATAKFGFTGNGTFDATKLAGCSIVIGGVTKTCTFLVGSAPVGAASSSSAAASSAAASSAAASSAAASSAAASSVAASSAASSVAGATTYLIEGTTDSARTNALKTALTTVNPGDTIILGDGTYTGQFKITRSGSVNKPITMRAATGAKPVLYQSAYGGTIIEMTYVNYWKLSGFATSGGQKGIVLAGSSHNVLENLDISNVGMEAVHFRAEDSAGVKYSVYNVIQNSKISNAGMDTPDYGEGIYIGSANSNWSKYTGSSSSPDKSDNNCVLDNTIGPNVKAEGIDIKEGSTGGWIIGNTFTDTGIGGKYKANSADSAIDVKGNGYLLYGNTMSNPNRPQCYADAAAETAGTLSDCVLDGFQIRRAYTGWGNDNKFQKNSFDPKALGNGISVANSATYGLPTGTVVCSDNTSTSAAAGLSNVSTTSCAVITKPSCPAVLTF